MILEKISLPKSSVPNQYSLEGGSSLASPIFCSFGPSGAINGAKIANKTKKSTIHAPTIANLFFRNVLNACRQGDIMTSFSSITASFCDGTISAMLLTFPVVQLTYNPIDIEFEGQWLHIANRR